MFNTFVSLLSGNAS